MTVGAGELRRGPTSGRAFRLVEYSEDGYLVELEVAATAWAFAAVWSFAANWATTPSCCIMPKASQLTWLSASLPFKRRATVTPEMVNCFPVGAMTLRSALWEPGQDQRARTVSPSPMTSTQAKRRPGTAL